MRLEECLFTKEHEWVHVEGGVARVGITEFAQKELGDIVYVNMGDVGRSAAAGESIGEIESVKAVAEVYAPVSGEITETNALLAESPEKVNSDPYGDGWLVMMTVQDAAETKRLMDFAAYQKYLAEVAH